MRLPFSAGEGSGAGLADAPQLPEQLTEKSELNLYLGSCISMPPRRTPWDPSTSAIEAAVWAGLFHSASNGGRHYDLLFPNLDWAFPANYTDVRHNAAVERPHYWTAQHPSHSRAHKGRICAVEIPPGEPVYNCYDCGVDATCCMCNVCFNREQHSDHNVSMHISQGMAICDCGDQASWKVELRCNANEHADADFDAIPELPEDFKESVRKTIKIALDTFLDMERINVQVIPKVHKCFADSMRDSPDEEVGGFVQVAKQAVFRDHKYGVDADSLQEHWYLLVWNDEFHSWDTAVASLRDAIACDSGPDASDDSPTPEKLAAIIDKFGYCILADKQIGTSDFLAEAKWSTLVRMYNAVQERGLTATIVNGRDLNRDLVGMACMTWLRRAIKLNNIRVAEYVKEQVGDLLVSKYSSNCVCDGYLRSTLPDLHPSKGLSGLLTEYGNIPGFSRGSLKRTSVPACVPVKWKSIKDGLGFDGDNDGGDELSTDSEWRGWYTGDDSEQPVPAVNRNTRIQLLFFLDMRGAKSIRKKVKAFLIPLVTATQEYRLKFATQITDILPQLEYLFATQDREWNLSLLDSFRLQVYHDPTIGTSLLENRRFSKILQSCISVTMNKLLPEPHYMLITPSSGSESDPSWMYRRTQEAELTVLQGLETILSFVEPGSERLFRSDHFPYLVVLTSYFEYCHTMKRKTGDHVEIEDRSYKMYYTRANVVYEFCESIGKILAGFSKRNVHVDRCITLLSTVLNYQEYGHDKSGKRMEDHVVSMMQDSFLLPSQSLLSQFVRFYKPFDASSLHQCVDSIKFYDTYDPFIMSAKVIVQTDTAAACVVSHVLAAQIGTGFWVRNGHIVDEMAWIRSSFYDIEGELSLIQVALAEQEIFPETLFKLWEVNKCIADGEPFENSVYQDRTSLMLLEMAVTFYHILTYRLPSDSTVGYKDFQYLKARAMICYSLCHKEQKYSELKEAFGAMEGFEEEFEEVSHYLPPKGVKEYGRYALKDELFSTLDPFDVLNRAEAADDIEQDLITKIAQIKHKNADDVVLKPQLRKLRDSDLKKSEAIAQMMKSRAFAKYLYKVFRFAIDSKIDDHVMVTLHLLHAIILDDGERYPDSDNHLQSFIDVPICDMLLMIAESDYMPKATSKKASTILELLLLKDDSVMQSLISCFGEDHIEEYKKSDHGRTLETKKERARRLALKRQQKIMAKMRGQQRAFMKQNKEYFSDLDESSEQQKGAETQEDEEEVRTCILCRNPENTDELFGLPALASYSNTFWTTPFDIYTDTVCFPPDYMVPGLLTNGEKQESAYAPIDSMFSDQQPVITGCPHGMHYSCFKQMLRDKDYKANSFHCPLCRNFCNMFVPSYPFPENPFDPCGPLSDPEHWQKCINGDEMDNLGSLATQVFDQHTLYVLSSDGSAAYHKVMVQLAELKKSDPLSEISKGSGGQILTKSLPLTKALEHALINTVRMWEIASRLKAGGKDEEVSAPSKMSIALVRSLIQYRVLLNFLPNDKDEKQPKESDESVASMPLIHQSVLSEVADLFFEGNETFESYCSYQISRSIANVLKCFHQSFGHPHPRLNFGSVLLDGTPNEIEDIGSELEGLYYGISLHAHGPLKKNEVLGKGPVDSEENVKMTCRMLITLHKRWSDQMALVGKCLCFTGSPLPPLVSVLKKMNTEGTMEHACFKGMLDNVAVKFEFPGPVRLLPLPEKLSDMLHYKGFQSDARYGEQSICLHCGHVFEASKKRTHASGCMMSRPNTFCLFFSPYHNKLDAILGMNQFMCASRPGAGSGQFVDMPVGSPYLNKHGEPAGGLLGAGESGVLDPERYQYITETWADHSLQTSVYRKWSSNSRRMRGQTFQAFVENLARDGEPAILTAQAMANAMGLNGLPPGWEQFLMRAEEGDLQVNLERDDDDDDEDDDDVDDDDDDDDGEMMDAIDSIGGRDDDSVGDVYEEAYDELDQEDDNDDADAIDEDADDVEGGNLTEPEDGSWW